MICPGYLSFGSFLCFLPFLACRHISVLAAVWGVRGKNMENTLKDLRADKGWSQAALGEHLDISRQSVNAIETGRYDPSLPLAFKIARLFDLKIEDVFTDGENT